MSERADGALWYLIGDNPEPIGPVSSELVKRGLEAGKIPPTAKIVRAGESEWVNIEDVPEFSAYLENEEETLYYSGGEASQESANSVRPVDEGWYVLETDKSVRGPLTIEMIEVLVSSGALKADARVSRPGGSTWIALCDADEFRQWRARGRTADRISQPDEVARPSQNVLAVDPETGAEVLEDVPDGVSTALAIVPKSEIVVSAAREMQSRDGGLEGPSSRLAKSSKVTRVVRIGGSPRKHRPMFVLAVLAVILAAVGGVVGLGILLYRMTLPTAGDAVAEGVEEGSRAPELNGEGLFHTVGHHRNIVPIYPIEGGKSPRAWHYHVTWKDGRVIEYERVNPAGITTETYIIQYKEGDARSVRKLNGYGVVEYEDEVSSGGLVVRRWRSGERNWDNCASIQREFDAKGRVAIAKCLDAHGMIVSRSDGCFIRKLSYSDVGVLSETACMQDDLAPIDDGNGVHRTTYRRDAHGEITEESYFATSGQRTRRRSDGCARRRSVRDEALNVVKESCLDASGVLQRESGETHASVEYTRDENGCWTEKRFLSAERETPEDVRFYQKPDRQCTALRFERRNGESTLVGVAWDVELTSEGLQAVKRCRVHSGHAQCPQAGYYLPGTRGAMVRWEYDDKGRATRKRCYSANGKPSTCDPSYPHEERYEYDEHGRHVATQYFDARGETATWFGVARRETSYNVLGRVTSDRYYDKSGKLTNDRCGTGGNVYRMDAKQRLVGIDQKDKHGALKTSRCRVSFNGIRWPLSTARVEVVRTPGGATKNEYYSASGKLLKTVDCSEPNAECYQ